MSQQTTNSILMIRPVVAMPNPQTLETNAFQTSVTPRHALPAIQREFDGAVEQLRNHGIEVTVILDSPWPETPDAMFPNNWFSTTSNGRHYLYPMLAENRRTERKPNLLEFLTSNYPELINLTTFEERGLFLEGTGSMVLDHLHQIAYAAISPRTSPEVLEAWAQHSGYEIRSFEAVDSKGKAIYHTNVMLSIGTKFVAIVSESIPNEQIRKELLDELSANRELIELSYGQMGSFCANILELQSYDGTPKIVLSVTALEKLNQIQKQKLEEFGELIPVEVFLIEVIGGGGIRCMIAELF
ncbi:MAG: hypothetical protein KF824_04560 [Fimbriimonadaceae bacterium]|nr:MAG: hypothetical protein KF824_04560 [Fimbriimonadaceae bacterium]